MIMRLSMVAGSACLIGCAMTAPAQAQQLPISVEFGGRMQFQWNSTSVDAAEAGEPIASNTFETRRVRLAADIRVGDWIRGFIEPDFALGRLQIKQAWMSLELDPALVVRAGQFKKPFSVINLTSSTAHPMIERGVRIRGLAESLEALNQGELSSVHGDLLIGEQHALLETQGYLAYDMGVALMGEIGAFGWQAGAFNGNGPDARDENGGKSVAARATYEVDIGTPVTLGAAWSRRELSWPAPGDPETRTGDAFEVDIELGGLREGWWLLGELSSGTNLATEERFLGAQGVLARFFSTGGARIEGIEPMARVSWGDPDDSVDGDAGLLLTPGLNVYFMSRNRLMFNWDVFVPEGDRFETQHAGRAQFNLYF